MFFLSRRTHRHLPKKHVAIIKAIKSGAIIMAFAASTSLSAQDIAPEESTSGEDKGEPRIIGNCHDIYNGTRLRGLRLKQNSRDSVKTHSMQINLFPRLKLESAIRAE